jgi:hypothetical protein
VGIGIETVGGAVGGGGGIQSREGLVFLHALFAALLGAVQLLQVFGSADANMNETNGWVSFTTGLFSIWGGRNG